MSKDENLNWESPNQEFEGKGSWPGERNEKELSAEELEIDRTQEVVGSGGRGSSLGSGGSSDGSGSPEGSESSNGSESTSDSDSSNDSDSSGGSSASSGGSGSSSGSTSSSGSGSSSGSSSASSSGSGSSSGSASSSGSGSSSGSSASSISSASSDGSASSSGSGSSSGSSSSSCVQSSSSSQQSSTSSNASSSSGSKGTIFISGYWPPTNIEVPNGMLNQFRSQTQGAKGEYVIDDYMNTGYRIVTIATTFPAGGGANGNNFGRGQTHGKWTVDYPDTSATFWNLMKKYEPIAVMTTSRNDVNKQWVLEIGSTNLKQSDWLLLAWNQGRPPIPGGANNDPAAAAGLPNNGRPKKRGNPPDATRNAGTVVPVSQNTVAIQNAIIAKLNATFAVGQLQAVKDPAPQGTAPDNYVSAFAGYHAVWYDKWSSKCKAGWHTHVDSGISVANASQAMKLQLGELINWLDQNP